MYALGDLDFNTIITFSNRISMLLAEMGRDSIKLKYYLMDDGLDKSEDHWFVKENRVGFSSRDR